MTLVIPRTATDSNPKADTLEPHEYGHMLGLIDEYFEAQFNRGGVRYTYFDGATGSPSESAMR
ncbi:hypothetical protein [Martelella mangrovi]|uniref:Uncharacterized protein n=1 Tax=Martelella mangrovi TaxID=1397477 RepID=A0ABV2IG36_9HYPH